MLSPISSEGSIVKYHCFHRCCCPPQWPQQHSVSAEEGTGALGIFIPECTCHISIFVCRKMNIPGQNSPNDNQAEIVVLPPDENLCIGELTKEERGASAMTAEEIDAMVQISGVSCGLCACRPNRKISDTIPLIGTLWWGWISGGEILILCPYADHFRVNLLGWQEVGE